MRMIGLTALILAATLITASAGRWTARGLRQPEIVLEITVCLALAGLLVSQYGWGSPGSAGRRC